MVEIELKFQIPPQRLAAVERAVVTSQATLSHLRAAYFDTPDRRLAAAQMALRLRLEDGVWVQTMKGRGDGHLRRLEHEVVVGRQRGMPALDLGRHAGTAAGQALQATLGEAADDLRPLFQTDVQRHHRIVQRQRSRVELAFDVGRIRCGRTSLALAELEFELKAGNVAGLLAVIRPWVSRHGLWLDVRSKAERGERLLTGQAAGPAVLARNPPLGDGPGGVLGIDQALRRMVGTCLQQILPNVSELAGGVGGPDHLHQARVGMRRLRSALQLFGADSAIVEPGWDAQLGSVFQALGASRDRDALAAGLLPELLAAGGPPLLLPPGPGPDACAELLRSPACTLLWLDLIDCAQGSDPADRADPPHAIPVAAPAAFCDLARDRLKRLHRQIVRDATDFMGLEDAARHRLRKRLKRLRYGIELTSTLYSAKAVKRSLAALKPAQDALGAYNDLVVAQALFSDRVNEDPQAWFALGWLAARRDSVLRTAARSLAKLPHALKL